jgi:hypothetical protein
MNNTQKSILLLLFISTILGGTKFDFLQAIFELVAIFTLILLWKNQKHNYSEIFVIIIFIISHLAGAIFNDITAFLLNMKLAGTFILTLYYFKRYSFTNTKIIEYFFWVNLFLIYWQYFTGSFPIPLGNIIGLLGEEYAKVRPVGVFLSPHISSTFNAITLLFFFKTKKNYIVLIIGLIGLLLGQSLTAVVAFIIQLIIIIMSQYSLTKIFSNLKFVLPSIIIGGYLAALSIEYLIDLLSFSGYTRWYSLEIILNQFTEPKYWKDIFTWIPVRYRTLIIQQEMVGFANEIGLIKIFIENGFILGLIILYLALTHIRFYSVFILISLIHYSYFFNTPFILAISIIYSNIIDFKPNTLMKGKLSTSFR